MKLSIPQIALLSRLLDEALPLDAGGRRLWLDRLSPEYQELAPALRSALLAGDSQAAAFERLATLPTLGSADDSVAANGLQPGARVGPYELIRPLGAGGMAQVWLARRADGAFKREVALKLPMLKHPRPDLEQRFARERDILASLEHPEIARFYDAGIDTSGLPYFAMEYVQGERLTDWCDAHRLAVRERLKLVLQVLDALQYAHEHEVIHRDIKPSNILVNEAGQVRLLDFGVAKLMGHDAELSQLTVVYGRALTPEYASPELARGDSVEPASDMYSLGVLMYELLTGCIPYGIKVAKSMELLEQAIIAAEVTRPSTHLAPEAGVARAVTQGKLVRQLRGDLDAIVLKALAKAPSDRYASAAALAGDLQRYLNRQPVAARPDHFTYRVTKLMQRRPAEWAAAATAVLAAAGLTYALTRPAPTAPVAPVAPTSAASPIRVVAGQPQPDKSIAVLPFVDMSEKKDQEYFSDGLSEELIDMLAKVPELRVPARTSSFYFKGKQATVPEIAKALGVADVLEGSVRKSGNHLRITAQLVRADNGYHLWSETYDRQLDDIFKVQDEIASAVVKALKISLMGGYLPESTDTQNIEAYNLFLQARSMLRRAHERADYERVVEYLRRAVDADPQFANSWALLSQTLNAEAHALVLQGIEADGLADQLKEEARRAAKQALKLNPGLPDPHLAYAGILLYVDLDVRGAAGQIQQALELDPNSQWATASAALQASYRGHFERALELMQKSIAIDPVNSDRYRGLAWIYYFAGKYPEALAASRKMFDLDPGARFAYHVIRGSVLLAQGDPAAALTEIENDKKLREICSCLALAYDALGRKAEADAALTSLEQHHADDNAYGIGLVYANRGQLDQAFGWFERAYRQHDTDLPGLRVEPLPKNVRSDPRFNALLRKLDLLE